MPRRRSGPTPGTLHLDRRVSQITAEAADSNDDELLDTVAMAQWFGYSVQWFEIKRSKGGGPPFERIGRKIRYRRGKARRWLDARTYNSTSEYPRVRLAR
jgi:hypothetical protein